MTTLPVQRTTPRIATERLVLRQRSPDDAEALFPALSDPALMRWWSRSPFIDLGEVRAYFADHSKDGWRCWAVTDADGSPAIGFVTAGEKRQGDVTEIGYLFGRAAHGRGIAYEAVSAVIDQLFAEGQRRVFADTDPDNGQSIGLLERLGFRLEGHLRGEWHTHIGVRDSMIYGLLAAEWRT